MHDIIATSLGCFSLLCSRLCSSHGFDADESHPGKKKVTSHVSVHQSESGDIWAF